MCPENLLENRLWCVTQFCGFFYKNRIVLSVYMIVLPNCQSLIVMMYVFICGKLLISILIRIFHAQSFHRPRRCGFHGLDVSLAVSGQWGTSCVENQVTRTVLVLIGKLESCLTDTTSRFIVTSDSTMPETRIGSRLGSMLLSKQVFQNNK